MALQIKFMGFPLFSQDPKIRIQQYLPGRFNSRVPLPDHLKFLPDILKKSHSSTSFTQQKENPILYKDGVLRGSTLFENESFSSRALNARCTCRTTALSSGRLRDALSQDIVRTALSRRRPSLSGVRSWYSIPSKPFLISYHPLVYA